MKNYCVICGRNIPIDETQMMICTKYNGIESVCLCHEGEYKLSEYILNHGGCGDVNEWLSRMGDKH